MTMSTGEINLELTRADLARTILNADADLLTKIAKYIKRVTRRDAVDYYDSAQFYADVDKAEEDIASGNYLSVKDSSDIDKLFS